MKNILAIGLSALISFSISAEELDDILGVFEEDESETFTEIPQLEDTVVVSDKKGDLSGSVSLSTSYNYHSHRSNSGTNYRGMQKLRARLNLQYDHTFNKKWKSRVAGFAFYDFAYLMHNRHDYTDDVRDDYEYEFELQEFWLLGKLRHNLDIKMGRQVVNWGRSDSLRVLDVLNPLDNREPGLADIEDIRLPVTMFKTDYYFDEWNLSAIFIPETRFSKTAPFGSDFSIAFDGLSTGTTIEFKEDEPADFGHPSYALALNGIFSGWDISFNAARYWRDTPYLDPVYDSSPFLSIPSFLQSRFKHSRLTMVGAGGNYTTGSWLFKGEIARIDGIDYTMTTPTLIPNPAMPFGPLLSVNLPSHTKEKTRIDALFGVEYYGIGNTTLSLEIVNRHIEGFHNNMKILFNERDTTEVALRYTQSFINDKLDITGLVVSEFDGDGGLARFDASYELRDALTISGGLIYFHDGNKAPYNSWDDNDRLFAEVKYSF